MLRSYGASGAYPRPEGQGDRAHARRLFSPTSKLAGRPFFSWMSLPSLVCVWFPFLPLAGFLPQLRTASLREKCLNSGNILPWRDKPFEKEAPFSCLPLIHPRIFFADFGVFFFCLLCPHRKNGVNEPRNLEPRDNCCLLFSGRVQSFLFCNSSPLKRAQVFFFFLLC